jgi:soluble lytic murein transglycosylase-like protein
MIRTVVLSAAALAVAQTAFAQEASRAKLDALIEQHAKANGVPTNLVHRVVVRESRYRPHVIGKGGAMGLMQIKLATARGLGYTGTAQGLLDPVINLTYAVRYLAGAYHVAGGNHDRAVMHYARGYYYAAKRKGMLKELSAQTKAQALAQAAVHAEASPAETAPAEASAGPVDHAPVHEYFRRHGEILF